VSEPPSDLTPQTSSPTPSAAPSSIDNRKSAIGNPPSLLPDESIPIPPRFWWLKRITIAAAAMLVFLIALRLWWGWVADRRFQAEIDRIVAAGEPIFPEDFNPKEKIPDEENAAKYYLRAAEALRFSPGQTALFDELMDDPRLVPERLDEIGQLIKDNAAAIRLVDDAPSYAACDWDHHFQSPAYLSLPSYYSGQRQLAKTLLLAAEHDFASDRYAAGVSRLASIVELGRCNAKDPFLIGQLVAWAIQALGSSRVMEPVLASESTQEGRDAFTQSTELTTQVRRLITLLRDSSELKATYHRSMLGERMLQWDMVESMKRGTTSMSAMYAWQAAPQASIPDVVWNTVLWPSITLDTVRLLKESDQRCRAIASMDIDFLLHRDEPDDERTFLSVLIYPLRADTVFVLSRGDVLFLRLVTIQRLAATGLAVRLFRFENGVLPRTLEELVPRYLPESPRDPMVKDGHLFVYRPGDVPAILYSVGENGIDDGGQFEIDCGTVLQNRTLDIPFFVNGDGPQDCDPPKSEGKASGEGGDDDVDEDQRSEKNGEAHKDQIRTRDPKNR